MCGIFIIATKNGIFLKEQMELILSNFKKLSKRGPDNYSLTLYSNCIIGFQRLAINDITNNGMQPFQYGDTFTICNGEIYNYDELSINHPVFSPKSLSDCEILPYLFNTYTFEESLTMLDGVFAICHLTKNKIYLARDRLGVKPIFYGENDNFFVAASEAKALDNLIEDIHQLEPSTIMEICLQTYSKTYNSYTSIPTFPTFPTFPTNYSYEESVDMIKNLLIKSVQKRMTSDREIGCLLSGGLDSSIISSILSKEMKKVGKTLHTFSVGFPDSADIIYARQVAAYIGSEHHEYIIQYEDALERIEDVIIATETHDTTSIRASTPMFLLCEWINKNFPHKVIFSGEGSDELFCGYLYFHKAPTPNDAHEDSIRLLRELYQYDVLRADRCTAGNGLELREPFLDKNLIDFVATMNPSYKVPREHEHVLYEKEILRSAFSGDNYLPDNMTYLPDNILWRRKAAFSDAVSSSQKPWYKWIQEYAKEKGKTESEYYKNLFYKNFSSYRFNAPLWLPRWSDVGEEPSATVLDVYKKEEH